MAICMSAQSPMSKMSAVRAIKTIGTVSNISASESSGCVDRVGCEEHAQFCDEWGMRRIARRAGQKQIFRTRMMLGNQGLSL
jgi:hypothetical protein